MSATKEESRKCEICEMDPYGSDMGNPIIERVVAEHDFNVVQIDGKHFCPITRERAETEDRWEEMSDEEMKEAENEILVKDGKKWKIGHK